MSDNEGVRVLMAMLGMDTFPVREPRFNIAPTQTLDVIQRRDEQLAAVPMSWGVSLTLPGKSGKMTTRRIQNSRSDKVWTSRLWHKLIAVQRVLVPVNGFYEWRRVNGKLDAAYYISAAERPALFLAGLYRHAIDGTGLPEVSVVTTTANRAMSDVHDRMPVILQSPNAAMTWLQVDERPVLDELMQPASDGVLKFTRVGPYVNKSTNDGPQCIEPLAA